MAWSVKYSDKALKQLEKLDSFISQGIVDRIREIANNDNVRLKGKALIGNKRGLWRYRVGSYRIICSIKDAILCVLVLELGHRKDIYD